MGKFSLDKIGGINNSVGNGLLSEASKALKSEHKKTEFIKYEQIVPNPMNPKSRIELTDDILELADSISRVGLDQPLVVKQLPDGNYMILTGHRRWVAIGELIKQGKWNEEHLVEAKIKDVESMELPISDKDKEYLSIAATNDFKPLTEAEQVQQAIELRRIYSELRAKGYKVLVTGYDDEGNEIGKSIAGKSTRQLVAEQIGKSPAWVGQVEKVENKGTDALKNALKFGNVSLSNAKDIADMPEKKQSEFMAKMAEIKKDDEQITASDISQFNYQKKKRTVTKEEDTVPGDGHLITEKTLRSDMKRVSKTLRDAVGVRLSDQKYAQYTKIIESLEKLLSDI